MAKKRKLVLLFYPKTSDTSWYRAPLSVLEIASQLDANIYENIIIDANINPNYKNEILKIIEMRHNDVLCVGISSMTGYQLSGTFEISKLIKTSYPSIPIILGGWHGSILPEQTLKTSSVDFVVRGQGELTFKELLVALDQKKDFKDIKGLSYKKSKRIFHNEDRGFTDINEFLPVNYDLIDTEKYIIKTDFGKRAINYISSYGCPYNCGFCAEITVNKSRWSGLNSRRVINDIEKLVKKHKIDAIFFDDNSFFVDIKRVREICKGIISRKLNITWGHVDGRVDNLLRLSEDDWKLLKKSGCKSLLIGAESGSDDVLKLINKRIGSKDIIKLLHIAKKYDISIEASFMAGLPKEPEAELNKTLDMIDQVYNINDKNKVLLFFYTPYPGTPLFEMAKEYGFKPPTSLNGWTKYDLELGKSPWLSEKYKRKLKVILSYYLPFAFLSKNAKNLIKKGGFKGRILKLLNLLALYRWKRRNFSFPVEYYMFMMVKRFVV